VTGEKGFVSKKGENGRRRVRSSSRKPNQKGKKADGFSFRGGENFAGNWGTRAEILFPTDLWLGEEFESASHWVDLNVERR